MCVWSLVCMYRMGVCGECCMLFVWCVCVCVCLVAKDGWVGADQSPLSGCLAVHLLGCL